MVNLYRSFDQPMKILSARDNSNLAMSLIDKLGINKSQNNQRINDSVAVSENDTSMSRNKTEIENELSIDEHTSSKTSEENNQVIE